MEDLELISSVKDDGSQKVEFSPSSHVLSPKFNRRKISCTRDFPLESCQLGMDIDHKSEQETCNATDSEKAAHGLFKEEVKVGGGIDYEHRMIKTSESVISPKPLPKRRRVSLVRDFPDAFLQLKGEKDFPKKTTKSENQKDVASDSEDNIEPLENIAELFRSGADIGCDLLSRSLGFEQKALLISPDKKEPLLLVAESNIKPGLLSHNLEFVGEQPQAFPDKEEALQLNLESMIPMTKLEFEHGRIISQNEGSEETKSKSGHGVVANFIGQSEDSELQWPKEKVMLVDGALLELEDKQTNLMLCSGMLPKRHKVSVVREFPDAFKRINGGDRRFNVACVSEDEEEPFENCPLPLTGHGLFHHAKLEEEPLEARYSQSGIHKREFTEVIGSEEGKHTAIVLGLMAASSSPGIQGHEITEVIGSRKDARGQGSGTRFCQGQRSGSEGVEGRIIVQALMAASTCPWNSQTKEGSKKKKKKKENALIQVS